MLTHKRNRQPGKTATRLGGRPQPVLRETERRWCRKRQKLFLRGGSTQRFYPTVWFIPKMVDFLAHKQGLAEHLIRHSSKTIPRESEEFTTGNARPFDSPIMQDTEDRKMEMVLLCEGVRVDWLGRSANNPRGRKNWLPPPTKKAAGKRNLRRRYSYGIILVPKRCISRRV